MFAAVVEKQNSVRYCLVFVCKDNFNDTKYRHKILQKMRFVEERDDYGRVCVNTAMRDCSTPSEPAHIARVPYMQGRPKCVCVWGGGGEEVRMSD